MFGEQFDGKPGRFIVKVAGLSFGCEKVPGFSDRVDGFLRYSLAI